MMLARVADSLYWMGRYIERAEHLSRLSDADLARLQELVRVRGVNRCMKLMSSTRFLMPSIHPKHSASSRASR